MPSISALFPMLSELDERSPSPLAPIASDGDYAEEEDYPLTAAARKRARDAVSPSLDRESDIKQGRGPVWVRSTDEDCGPEVLFGKSILYQLNIPGVTFFRPDMELRRVWKIGTVP